MVVGSKFTISKIEIQDDGTAKITVETQDRDSIVTSGAFSISKNDELIYENTNMNAQWVNLTLDNDVSYSNNCLYYSSSLNAGDVLSFTFSGSQYEEIPCMGSSASITIQNEVSDIYDEYLWTGTKFEKVGTTEVNLTDYYTKTEVDAKIQTATDLQLQTLGILNP